MHSIDNSGKRPPPDSGANGRAGSVGQASAWLNSTLGQTILTEENGLLEKAVRRMHGDTLLWSGVSASTADLSKRCMVRHRIFNNSQVAPGGVNAAAFEPSPTGMRLDDMSCFSSTLEEIPLRNGCIDAMVIHHTLELSRDPRAALREATRVLQPGGQLVVCAFNRYGAFSICRWGRNGPRRFISPMQLQDWLDVLGFETVVAPQFALYRPPFFADAFEAPRWDRLRELVHRSPVPLGNILLMHMRKKSLSIRPDWRAVPRRSVALAGRSFPKLVDSPRRVP